MLPAASVRDFLAAALTFEAGATLAHVHVRNDDETPSSDREEKSYFQHVT